MLRIVIRVSLNGDAWKLRNGLALVGLNLR